MASGVPGSFFLSDSSIAMNGDRNGPWVDFVVYAAIVKGGRGEVRAVMTESKTEQAAHAVAWISVPRLNSRARDPQHAQRLNRFLAFQGLLNDRLLQRTYLLDNPVLDAIEAEAGKGLLLPLFLPQWALLMGQMMLARQQLMIELLGDSVWSELAEKPALTVRRQVQYDDSGQAHWHEPNAQPNPAQWLLETSRQVHGWWESCQSLLPELGALQPEAALASPVTRRLCCCVEEDYLNANLPAALATIYLLENALSHDVTQRLRRAVERCQDEALPVPGLRFFDTLQGLARESSALAQHFIEAWFFFSPAPNEIAFLQQIETLCAAYEDFWRQFLPFCSGATGHDQA